MSSQTPWVSGPAEILKHGLELLKKDTDTNRRLSMISIDNAVELMIKTYLGLPQRITGLTIPRTEYQEFAESFPRLLDALEKHAGSKLSGVDLGEIEWFHRLRNQLYHQGNGLTVERDKIEVYAELANVLFSNLFGFRLVEPEEDETMLLGKFMEAWANLERVISEAIVSLKVDMKRRPTIPMEMAEYLEKEGLVSRAQLQEFNQIRKIRNDVVHGKSDYRDALKPDLIKRIMALTAELQARV